MFFGGKLKGMFFKLISDNGEFIVICFMVYVVEKDLICWVEYCQFFIIFCMFCGSQENLQCKQIGNMLLQFESFCGLFNGDYGELDWMFVCYIYCNVVCKCLFGFYCVVEVVLVILLCDGMNFVYFV